MRSSKIVACAALVFAGALALNLPVAHQTAAAAAAAAKDEAAPSPELETLAQNWAVAMEEGKAEWMKPMLASGYVYVNPRGRATDGETLLRQMKDRKVLVKIKPKDGKFRMHKDAAVMTGVCTITGEVDGQKVDGEYRYVDVFQRADNRWVAIASTLTRVVDGGS